jgi:hypothetical protein
VTSIVKNYRFEFARGCLAGAATITTLWIMLTLFQLVGLGAFNADYYYLQIREFVPPENREAMEFRVIEIYNIAQQRAALVRVVVLSVHLTLLLLARRSLKPSSVVEVGNSATESSIN